MDELTMTEALQITGGEDCDTCPGQCDGSFWPSFSQGYNDGVAGTGSTGNTAYTLGLALSGWGSNGY